MRLKCFVNKNCYYWQRLKGSNDGADELGLANMGGVYVVLLGGCVIATIVGLIDCLIAVRKRSKKCKVKPFVHKYYTANTKCLTISSALYMCLYVWVCM